MSSPSNCETKQEKTNKTSSFRTSNTIQRTSWITLRRPQIKEIFPRTNWIHGFRPSLLHGMGRIRCCQNWTCYVGRCKQIHTRYESKWRTNQWTSSTWICIWYIDIHKTFYVGKSLFRYWNFFDFVASDTFAPAGQAEQESASTNVSSGWTLSRSRTMSSGYVAHVATTAAPAPHDNLCGTPKFSLPPDLINKDLILSYYIRTSHDWWEMVDYSCTTARQFEINMITW